VPKYTQESVERVKDAIDMVDLVGSKTELRRSGASRMEGLCPFHDERTPSFGIDPTQKVYHCFGCGVGGDAITFVRETEGLDVLGAIEVLADRYGVELELAEENPAEAAQRQRRARLYELLERTTNFYVRYLWETDEAAKAREYLLGRGLDEDVLRRFRVGYSPSAWDKIFMASRRAGFSAEELYASGLATRAKGEGRLYDRFRGRIMFPLTDVRGRVIGHGARAMGESRGAKYINTPESELFQKRRLIYAADLARAAAAKAGSVLVVEGYTDVIMLHQAGFANTVAIMGTSMTDEQVKALVRLAPVAHLALDADNAGQEAMLRAARVAGKEKLELRVVPLPPGLDPADLIAQQGDEAMGALIGRSMPFLRFEIRRIVQQADTSTSDRVDLVLDTLRPYFAEMRRGTMRDELTQWVENALNLPQNGVERYLARPREASPSDMARAMRGGEGGGGGFRGGGGGGRGDFRGGGQRGDFRGGGQRGDFRGGESRGGPRGEFRGGGARPQGGLPQGGPPYAAPAAPAAGPSYDDPGSDRPPIDESIYFDPGADDGSSFDPGPAAPRRHVAPPPGHGGAAGDLATIIARTEEVERRFLAFCLALPDHGGDALAKLNPDEHFTSGLTRRAAAHLRTHLKAPRDDLPPDDPELDALMTELVVRSHREPASPPTLDAQRLQLELRRVDRRLAAIRASGEGGATELARARQAIKDEFDLAIERANAS
jgi:DNA primase